MENQDEIKKPFIVKKPLSIKASKDINQNHRKSLCRKMTEPKLKQLVNTSKEIKEIEDIVPLVTQKLFLQKLNEYKNIQNQNALEDQDVKQQINDLDIRALNNKYKAYLEINYGYENQKLIQHIYSIKKNLLFLIFNDSIKYIDFCKQKLSIQTIYIVQDPKEKIDIAQLQRSHDYLLFFTQIQNQSEILIYKILLSEQNLEVVKFSKVQIKNQNQQAGKNILKGLKDIRLTKNFLYVLTFSSITRINIDNQNEQIYFELKESSMGSLRKLNNYFYVNSDKLVYLSEKHFIKIVQFGKKDYQIKSYENISTFNKILVDQNFKLLFALKNNKLIKYQLNDFIEQNEDNNIDENKIEVNFSFNVTKIMFLNYLERLCVIGVDKTVICNKAELEILYSFELHNCLDVLQTSQKVMCIINSQEQELMGHVIDPNISTIDSYQKNYKICQSFFIDDTYRKMKFFKVAKTNKIVFVNYVQNNLKIFKIKKYYEKQLCLVQDTYQIKNEIQRLFFSRDQKSIFYILSYKLIQYNISKKQITQVYNLQQKQNQKQLLHIQFFQSLDGQFVFFGSQSQRNSKGNDTQQQNYTYYCLDLSSKQKIKQYELIKQLEDVKALKVFQNSKKSRFILYVIQRQNQFIVKRIDIPQLVKILKSQTGQFQNIQKSIELICRLKVKKNLDLKQVYIHQFSVNRFFLQLVCKNDDCRIFQSSFYIFKNFKFHKEFIISHTSLNIAYNQKFTYMYYSYQQSLICYDIKKKKEQQQVKMIKKEPQYLIYNYFQNTVFFISESGLFFYDQKSTIKLKKITDDVIPYNEPSFHGQDQYKPVFFDKKDRIYYIQQIQASNQNFLIRWDIKKEKKTILGSCSSYYIVDKKIEQVYQIESEKNRSFLYSIPLNSTKLEAKSLIEKTFFKKNSLVQQGFRALCNKIYSQKMHDKYLLDNRQTELNIENLNIFKRSQISFFIFFMCFMQFDQIEKLILEQEFNILSLKRIFQFKIWLKDFVDKECKRNKVFQYIYQRYNSNFIKFMKYLGTTFYKNLRLTNEDFYYLIQNSSKHVYIQNLIATQLRYVFKDNYDEQFIDQSQRIQRHYYNYEKEHQVLQLYKKKFDQQKLISFTTYRLIKTNYKLQLQTGSKQFIELLEFLRTSKQSCKNQFGNIIEHKFQTIQNQMIIILLLHFLNSLLYYFIIFQHNIRFLCILISVLVSIVAYSREILIFQFNMDYQNVKNQHLFDTILVIFMVLGFIFNYYIGQQQYKKLDYYNFFVLLALNVRFMIDLRVFTQLRSMIAVIKQIIRDIFYFIMLQGLMIYFFLVLQKTADDLENVADKNYIDYAHASIQLLFGRYFIRDKTYGLQLLIYWIFRIVFVMVISKMLIGLVQLTMSQYKQNKSDIDLQETIDIMLNQNKFIYMLRKYNIFGLNLSKQDSYYYYYLEEKPDIPTKIDKIKKPEPNTEIKNDKQHNEINDLKQLVLSQEEMLQKILKQMNQKQKEKKIQNITSPFLKKSKTFENFQFEFIIKLILFKKENNIKYIFFLLKFCCILVKSTKKFLFKLIIHKDLSMNLKAYYVSQKVHGSFKLFCKVIFQNCNSLSSNSLLCFLINVFAIILLNFSLISVLYLLKKFCLNQRKYSLKIGCSKIIQKKNLLDFFNTN